MATIEHCLFCFESLAAHLEDRPSMTLAEVERSYSEYSKTVLAAKNPKTAAAATGPSANASVGGGAESKLGKLTKRLPALRRLAGGGSSSSSSSSSSSGSSANSSSSSSTTDLPVDTPATSVSSLDVVGRKADGAKEQAEREEEGDAEEDAEAEADEEEEDEEDDDDDDDDDGDSEPVTASPLFVTWNTLPPPSRSGTASPALRGCIGTFDSQALSSSLADYALTSALHDTRFDPVSRRELPSLQAVVTLLTNFEPVEDAMDWTVGKHGLRIAFTYHGRRYGATYLPDVAAEQGWTKDETLVSLMRKAGWMGRRERWRDVDLKVVRYQGKKCKAAYRQFKAWRDWEDARASKSR